MDDQTNTEVSRTGILLIQVFEIIGRLPLSVRSATGFFFGLLFGLLPIQERRFGVLQLKWLLREQYTPFLAAKVFASLGQTLLESINLHPLLSGSKGEIVIENPALLRRLIESPHPAIFLSAHTGNWDLLAAYAAQQGLPIHTIGVRARINAFQAVLDHLRSKYGAQPLWRDSSGVRDLLRILKGNGHIAALIDQDTNVKSTFSSFFGVPAHTPSALISLAERSNAAIYSTFIFRTGFLKYEVLIDEIPYTGDVQAVLDEYHRRLENGIRRFPEQWVWFHKRWRSLPNGKRMSSAEYLQYLKNICLAS